VSTTKTAEALTRKNRNEKDEQEHEYDDMDLDLDMLLDSENFDLDMVLAPTTLAPRMNVTHDAAMEDKAAADEYVDKEVAQVAAADLDLDLLLGSENEDLDHILDPDFATQENSRRTEEEEQSNDGDDDAADDNAAEAQLKHDILLAEEKYFSPATKTAAESTEPSSISTLLKSGEVDEATATTPTKSVTETAAVLVATTTSQNHATATTAAAAHGHGHGDCDDDDSTWALSTAMSAPGPFSSSVNHRTARDFHHHNNKHDAAATTTTSSRFATPQRRKVQQQKPFSSSRTVQSTRSSHEKFTASHEHYHALEHNIDYAGMSVYDRLYADAWNRKRILEERRLDDEKRLEQACSFLPDISASIQSFESSPHRMTKTTTRNNDDNDDDVVNAVKESVFDRLYRSRKPSPRRPHHQDGDIHETGARSRSSSPMHARTPIRTRTPVRTRQQPAAPPPPQAVKPSPRLLSNPPTPRKQSVTPVPTKASVAIIKAKTQPRAAAKAATAPATTMQTCLGTTSKPSKDTAKQHVVDDKDTTPLVEPLEVAATTSTPPNDTAKGVANNAKDIATPDIPKSALAETSTDEVSAAATRIQACWRQRTEMQKYHSLHAKFVVLQAVIRGHHDRCKTTTLKNAAAAQSLQTCWRRHKAVAEFNKARVAAALL
jgi:hypothetical protein